jgi:hypothetical protein
MPSVILDGRTFNATDFFDRGYWDDVDVDGTDYPRFLAMFVSWLNDAGVALTTTATGSINFSTLAATDTGSVTLAETRPFKENAFVIITGDSDSTNWALFRVTADVTTTTLSYECSYVNASAAGGTETAYTVQISGPRGSNGAAGANGTGIDVDTASNHGSINPTASNTLYFESDTGRSKIGDGSTAYSSLPFIDGMDDTNTFAVSTAHNPSAGTITVSLSALDEIKDVRPTGDDTIDFTNVDASNSTVFRMRMTNGGAHTLSWEVDGTAATSTTLQDSFTFTSSGEDDCIVEIDEGQNITIARWRANI